MNREDIIRIAREAGLRVGTNLSGVVLVGSPAEIGLAHLTIEELERFAALVAAAEREACAELAVKGTDEPVQTKTLEILRKERERIAAAIRARGRA
jgi:hypothetical protein